MELNSYAADVGRPPASARRDCPTATNQYVSHFTNIFSHKHWIHDVIRFRKKLNCYCSKHLKLLRTSDVPDTVLQPT